MNDLTLTPQKPSNGPHRPRIFFAALASAHLLLAHCFADGPSPVFKTGFEDESAFLTHFAPKQAAAWKVEDESVVAGGDGVNTALANSPLSPNCKVELDITPIEDVEAGGFSGVKVGSVLFLARLDGFRYVYHIEGSQRESSKLIPQIIELGRTYHWEILRQPSEEGGYTFQWIIDGNLVDEFAVPPTKGTPETLSLLTNRFKARFDNVALYEGETGK